METPGTLFRSHFEQSVNKDLDWDFSDTEAKYAVQLTSLAKVKDDVRTLIISSKLGITLW